MPVLAEEKHKKCQKKIEKFIFKKGETYFLDEVYAVENSFAAQMEKAIGETFYDLGISADDSDSVKFLATVSITIEPVCNRNQNGFYFNNGIYDRFNSRPIRDFR